MKDILKKALYDKGMSQKELAEAIFVTPQAVSKWINGESRPTTDNVIRIKEVLGVDLIKETARSIGAVSSCNSSVMKHKTIQELDTFEKAVMESQRILGETDIRQNYSHQVYFLLQKLLPAIIGLTYHQHLNCKEEEDDLGYDGIYYNLEGLFEELDNEKKTIVFETVLERDFYMMGGDLFESFDEYKIPDHDFCQRCMENWYAFQSMLPESHSAQIYDDLRIAVFEIMDKWFENE
ncbi:MAG: helix-turn-helix transcriptional regulator [Erysipelotrichaceae bacterium]|nr:helix-turn-helix transcriptional regulator [Oscillospiraceae bacterium]MBR0420790.1 helix-turn-helix transcriptional regulator [Erysipelotrichaceae bacterium]